MKIIPTSIEKILIIEPDVFKDHRGFFMETYHQKRYQELGVNRVFVQDNLSFSRQGTLRGLHYQIQNPQAKLVQVISGEIYDVAIDIRAGSPSFGQWVGVHLSDKNNRQLFIPEGFAHGFCVLSDTALFSYKCSKLYAPDDESGILWSDSSLNIDWPIKTPTISDKDSRYPTLSDVEMNRLPVWENQT
jgi:dTDP-4-dehydrorhamnose 3,5-epimerase